MKRWFISIAITAISAGLATQFVYAKSREAERIAYQKEVKKLNQQIAELYHELLVHQIIQCESSGIHNSWGDNGKSYGIAQFKQRTFYWLAEKEQKQTGRKKKIYWKSKYDQIYLLKWSLKNGYENHWTCWEKVVNKPLSEE